MYRSNENCHSRFIYYLNEHKVTYFKSKKMNDLMKSMGSYSGIDNNGIKYFSAGFDYNDKALTPLFSTQNKEDLAKNIKLWKENEDIVQIIVERGDNAISFNKTENGAWIARK